MLRDRIHGQKQYAIQLFSDVLRSIWGVVHRCIRPCVSTANCLYEAGKKHSLLLFICVTGTYVPVEQKQRIQVQSTWSIKKSGSTAQSVLLVSHKGDIPLENWWRVPSLFLLSRTWQLCARKVGLDPKWNKAKMQGKKKKSAEKSLDICFFKLTTGQNLCSSSDFLNNCCYCCCIKS